MDQKIRSLLDDPRFREYHRGLKPDFNTFDVLRNADYEIRQSNVLAWLLQPEETHGVGSAFLEGFVCHVRKRLADADAKPLPEVGLRGANFEVRREWCHVDVSLHFERENCVIAVENKMDPATEAHVQQVRRYERCLRRRHPDVAVRSVLLTTSPEGSFHVPGIANVGWEWVRNAMRSLMEREEPRRFRAPAVRQFIEQYLTLLDRWLDPVGAHGARELLDEHREILADLRRMLGKDGEDAVLAKMSEGGSHYGKTLLRLAKESGQSPMDLRAAASRCLRERDCPPMASGNPAGTEYWLTWTDADLAETGERLGGSRRTLAWTLTFTYRGVLVGFSLRDPPGETNATRTLVDRLRDFLKTTPINRQKSADYRMVDRGFGWYRLYETSLLSWDEFAELSRSEAQTQVIQRLEAFMDSEESEYQRIADTFRGLAFRADEPAPTPEDSA